MKKGILVLLALIATAAIFAQAPVRYKVAVFAPLYLDSAYDAGNNYRFSTSFPKYLNPGLEFYMGTQAALDSLNRVGAPIEAFIIDSRSATKTVAEQLASPELSDLSMIIGHANPSDARTLAEAALQRKIPFISATLPNDAGITANPYYVVLNSTLRMHSEGIYKYLQKYHSLDNITVFTKAGAQEAQLKEFQQHYAKATSGIPLKLKYQDIGSNFTAPQLARSLDSTKRNIIVVGSLDLAFASKLAQQLTLLRRSYRLTLVGTPTWDGIDYRRPEFKNLETIYTTPFYYGNQNALATRLANEFQLNQTGKPTDYFFRGYETMLRFGLLLLDTKKDVASNLSRKGNYVFTPMDIQPVFLNRQTPTLDYFENSKLFFVRVINGVRSASPQ